MFFKNLFKHRHKFKYIRGVDHVSEINPLSGIPQTAIIYRCRCGKEKRELTDAGKQQVYEWGDEINHVLGSDDKINIL